MTNFTDRVDGVLEEASTKGELRDILISSLTRNTRQKALLEMVGMIDEAKITFQMDEDDIDIKDYNEIMTLISKSIPVAVKKKIRKMDTSASDKIPHSVDEWIHFYLEVETKTFAKA